MMGKEPSSQLLKVMAQYAESVQLFNTKRKKE
jgi:hypothetical protein